MLADGPLEVDAQYDANGSISMRFGSLNLLAFISAERFERWRKVTETLKAKAPVTRSDACRTFREHGI